MSTSSEIKQRASALAEKTDVNSITPKEVGGIMFDLASHSENVLRNSGTLGIRKVYESVAAMEADATEPVDLWGEPIKKGNLVVIYDGTDNGVDNNKIYAFMKPGWELATKLDAAYATKAELDAIASRCVPIKIGKNLIDLNSENIIADKMLYKGKASSSDKYNISDYIQVDENTEYCYSISNPSKYVITGGAGVAFYDKQKNLLGYTQEITSSNVVYTTPEGCYYMRLSLYKSTTKYDVQLEKGNRRSGYELYSVCGGYIEENKGIERIKEDVDALRKDVYIESPVSELLVRPNREFSELYYLKESDFSDVYDYGKIASGASLKVFVENGNTSKILRFYDSYSYVSTAQFVDVPVTSGSVNDIVVPEGYNYLKLCVGKDAKPTVNIVASTKEVLVEIEKNTISANQVSSILGSNASKGYADSLVDGESCVLDNFPLHCKKGLAMSMSADIVSFSKIVFGKGYEMYRGRWLEIDDTKVVLKGYESNAYTIESIEHGLTIEAIIKVSLACNYDGKCKVVVMTLNGMFTHVFNWGYDGNYNAIVKCLGSKLNNVYINATTTDFRQSVWFFGASYLGVNKNRLLGQLKNLGYFNYMIDNLAGMGSNDAYNDLVKCLKFGTPKYLVWCLGFNDYKNQENAISAAKKVEKICEDKNISLVFAVYASVPERDMSMYQEWLRNSGHRLIDFDKAVGSPIYESGVNNWYDGYLSSDNVHPTELGAKAMAMQVLIDFPEIMQYGLYKDDVTLDDTETDK